MPQSPGHSPSKIQLILAFASIYLIWGSTYLGVRIANETLPPLLMASTRFLVAGSVLYVFARLRGSARPGITQWKPALFTGLTLVLIGNGCVAYALRTVPSGLAAILIATEPAWIVVLAWAWFGRKNRPNRRVTVGLLIGFLGMMLLISSKQTSSAGEAHFTGVLLIIVSAIAWAIGTLYASDRKLEVTTGKNPVVLSIALQMLAGGAMLFTAGTLSGEWTVIQANTVSTKSLLALGYLTFFGTLIGFSTYSWLIRVVSPSLASTYAYVNPVVALLLGWALAGETLSLGMVVASAIIISSVVLITSQSKPISGELENGAEIDNP